MLGISATTVNGIEIARAWLAGNSLGTKSVIRPDRQMPLQNSIHCLMIFVSDRDSHWSKPVEHPTASLDDVRLRRYVG